MRERYDRLRQTAIDTLKELGYYRDGVSFEKTRYYPYPLLRYQIAKELYNIPGATLVGIGRIMGVTHSTLTIGMSKLSSYLASEDARILRAFKDKISERDLIKVDNIWGIDDDHAFLYLLIMEDMHRGFASQGSMEWYEENDDLAQFVTQ